MVQVIDDPTSAGIFGQIGRGLGKGLSEQLPKEIERGRLSQGLRDLEQKSKGGALSPFQQAAELAGIPGMSPQLQATLQPLLENAQVRQQFLDRRQQATGQEPQAAQASQTQVSQSPSTWEPLSGTTEAIEQRAAQRLVEQPQRFKTVDQAVAYERERAANQQAIISEVDEQLDKNIQEAIQKAGPGVYGDIPGEMLQKIRSEAYQKGDTQNIAPKKLAQDAAKQALEFAKQRGSLKKVGDLSFFSTSPSDNRRSIQSLKNAYEKEGQSRLFVDDLISTQNLSRNYASYLAKPPSKEIRSYVDAQKTPGPLTTPFEKKSDLQAKVSTNAAEKIKPNDSLFSVGLLLEQKGYDPKQFLSEVERLYREDKITLTDWQQNEMSQPWPARRTLGDLYLFPLVGLGKLAGES